MQIMSFCIILVSLVFSITHVAVGNTVKVGAVFAKSSKMAFGNIEALNAVRFAIDELNEQGGVLGKQIELLEFDNKGSALGSKIAAQKAVEAEVVIVFGANWSSHSLAMAPVLQQAKIPMISPIATNPDVTKIGNYIFRICYIDPFQGVVLSNFALQSLNAKTAGILVNVNDRYSEGLSEVFREYFSKNGGKILFTENYLENTSDFSKLFDKVKKYKPNVIFLPAHTKLSAYILKQAQNEGITTTFLGGDGWNDTMYKIAGDAIEGHYYSSHWHEESPRETNRSFVEKYKRSNRATYPVSALAEDCVMLFADAVKRANSLDPTKIRDALEETKLYNGVTGEITFNHHGDPIKSAVILRFENGTSTFVKSIDPN